MKEKLEYGFLGNGITVWDASRTIDQDYPTLAHIDYDRTISYYGEVSEKAKTKIEHFARYGNMSVSQCQPETMALRPVESPVDGICKIKR